MKKFFKNLNKLIFLFLIICVSNAQTQKYKVSNQQILIGGAKDLKSSDNSYSSTVAFGQPLVGYDTSSNNLYKTNLGIWSIYLREPAKPFIKTTRGVYTDRINISWIEDILSGPPNSGYKLYRQTTTTPFATINNKLDTLFSDTRQGGSLPYPGEMYEYTIEGINKTYGVGSQRSSIGYIAPTGSITGRVLSRKSLPVYDVEVSLSPMLGRSLEFNGINGKVVIPANDSLMQANKDGFAIEFWLYAKNSTRAGVILGKGSSLSNFDWRFDISEEGKIRFAVNKNDNTIIYSDTTNNIKEAWHHIAGVLRDDSVFIYVDGLKKGSGVKVNIGAGNLVLNSGDIYLANYPGSSFYEGRLDDFRGWKNKRSDEEIFKNYSRAVETNSPGLAGYWKFNEGVTNFALDNSHKNFEGQIIGATWNNKSIPNSFAPVRTSAFTDTLGNYKIEGIYFDLSLGSTFYTVTPTKFNHANWEPINRTVTFNASNSSKDEINFTDNSMISITGNIRYGTSDCYVKNVELLVDDKPQLPRIVTGNDGSFTIEREPGTSGRITPKYFNHTFNPAYLDFQNLENPISGIVFTDNKLVSANFKVAGGKNRMGIGRFNIILKGQNCIVDTNTTNAVGETSFNNLPPIAYEVKIIAVDSAGQIEIPNGTLDLRDTLITSVDTTIIWYAPLRMEITSNARTVCTPEINIAKQNQALSLKYEVFEKYNTTKTLLDTGLIEIIDDISYPRLRNKTLRIKNGIARDTIYPYAVNLSSGGEHPNQLGITATAKSLDTTRSVQEIFWALIEGERPRENTFSTASPQIPFLILHDPPGDGSFSSFEESTTSSTSFSMSLLRAGTQNDFTKISLGPDMSMSTGAFVSVGFDVDVTTDFNNSTSVTRTQRSAQEQVFTFTTTETRTTTQSDNSIGDGEDFFIGGAVNLIYGISDSLKWDTQNCRTIITPSVFVVPQGFTTTYMYTANHILNTVIPNALTINDSTSAKHWRRVLANNDSNKARASFRKNISFNSGPTYSYKEEGQQTETNSYEFELITNNEFGLEAGATFAGIGGTGGYSFKTEITTGSSNSQTRTNTQSISYQLQDDDISGSKADHFTVDVKTDPVYGTPVFNLKAGETSCPWEPNTQPRDGVQLTADRYSVSDILPTEKALFKLILTNTSQTNETRDYYLSVVNGTNPDGAIIKINGVTLENRMKFTVPGRLSNNTVRAVLTIERGPIANTYNNIGVKIYSACDEDSEGPGTHKLTHVQYFDVEFIAPCSPIMLAGVENNWYANQFNNDTVDIIFKNYETRNVIQKLKLQYRSVVDGVNTIIVENNKSKQINESETFSSQKKYTGSNGKQEVNNLLDDWFDAIIIPGDSIEEDGAMSVKWNISGLVDGKYALRAAIECPKLTSFSSEIIGVIDREAPKVVGLPEPADRILNTTDEIKITFNENIQKNILTASNFELRDLEGGNPVAFTWVATERSIVITPDVQNNFIENKFLKMRVKNIKDKFGNFSSTPIDWEFKVDKNPIKWENSLVRYAKFSYSPQTVEVKLVNVGAEPMDFEIFENHYWLDASPLSGTLNGNSATIIQLKISESLKYGKYQDFITARTNYGDERLDLDFRIMADPPRWNISTSQFQYSMGVVTSLKIEDSLSTDEYDMIGAFYGNECRGVAKITNIPNVSNKLFFLTIYSNRVAGDTINLRVWHALKGVEYSKTNKQLTFQSDLQIGSILQPDTISVVGEVYQRRELAAGWNWLSFNLRNESMTTTNLLKSISASNGDLIKDQNSFSQYTSGIGWLGSLNAMDFKKMYMLKLSTINTFEITGIPVKTYDSPIPIRAGWNWIGYLPQYSSEVSVALSNLENAQTDDIIKSQTTFAMYVAGHGWFGSLKYLVPGFGYQLKSSAADTLIYPSEILNTAPSIIPENNSPVLFVADSTEPKWNINPSSYQYSMSIVGLINYKTRDSLVAGDMIGAFSGTECIGVAKPIYIELLKKYYLFMMVYNNQVTGNNNITFKAYDAIEKRVYDVPKKESFVANNILGILNEPYRWVVGEVTNINSAFGVPKEFALHQNYPNPFNPETKIKFDLPTSAKVKLTVYNSLGQEVEVLVNKELGAGRNEVTFNSKNLPSGLYFYKLESANKFRDIKKMVLLK